MLFQKWCKWTVMRVKSVFPHSSHVERPLQTTLIRAIYLLFLLVDALNLPASSLSPGVGSSGRTTPMKGGRICRKNRFIQSGMSWWDGVRMLKLVQTTEIKTWHVFTKKTKSKYLEMSGTPSDESGKMLATSKRNTIMDNKTVMVSVIFSQASAGM